MELISVKEVMQLCKVGRPMATRLIRESGLALPRVKGGKYLVVKGEFERWLKER